MGKADRIRDRNVRARIAAQQAAARKAEQRRRAFIAFGSILGVVAIVVVLIVVKGLNKPAPAAAAGKASTSATVESQITSVPAGTLDSVGKGSTSPLTKTAGNNAILTADGKPLVLYMGAEYCPYCAAERWALAVALSRFGTFSNLHFIHSSSTDVYPSTPTLTFYKSSYTSKYITFQPVELQSETPTSEGYANLQTPTTEQADLMNKWDAPPYVPSSDKGAYPFVDFGNQYLVLGAQYLPSALAKLSWSQVATDIRNPSTTVAKDIDGTANSITAAICKITNNAPSSVCNSTAAQAGEGSL
jgi:thiol-disulfide isomerase/thioredoxin